jgi:glycine cleavage system aminomethyltransferase T
MPREDTMPNEFDMSAIQRGARLRRSPYFAMTQKYGCTAYTVYNHTFLPSSYDDPEREYQHLLEHVAVWDVAVERNVEISGPDGFEFMQRLTPRDMRKCKVGQGKYVLIVDQHGGIINDPVLTRMAESTFWLALADSDVLLWARGVAVNAGLDVTVRELDVAPMQVQGPKSKQVMQALFGAKLLDLPYYHFFETSLDGIPVAITRTGWTGEVGYEIYLKDPAKGEALWERVMAAGKPYHIKPTGPSDIRRIEAGILNYGADMTIDDTPYHVGLARLVDLDKPEFIGQAALRTTAKEGVDRKLVGIEIGGPRIEFNTTKWPVHAAGGPVGRVTSAIHSPRLGKNIGYAMVPIRLSTPGTTVQVMHPDGERQATVVPMPFIDPKKEIPKS